MSSGAEAAPAPAAVWRPEADPPTNPLGCACLAKAHDPIASAAAAKEVFPGNAPGYGNLPDGLVAPEHLAALTTKLWGPGRRVLSVSFLEPGVPQDLRQKILEHMNAWQPCAVQFALVPNDKIGDVRITLEDRDPVFGGGFWSLLGTDIVGHPKDRATMCLQGFSMATRESEFIRVVRHETGHTLGFPHEHMRAEIVNNIDREAAYKYYAQPCHGQWSRQMVDRQVLTPLDSTSFCLQGTSAVDRTSIMCYSLPGEIMKDGIAVGGIDIDKQDRATCFKMYPVTTPRTYVVQPDDTLWELGKKFATDIPMMALLNPTITKPDMIVPGQVLNLP